MSAHTVKSGQELMQRWRLDSKKILVTGSTKGIGFSIANELLAMGASVWVVSRSEEDVAETTAKFGAEFGGDKVQGCAADISTDEGRKKLIDSVRQVWGTLDGLVNNAGTNVRKPALEATDEEYSSIMKTNMDSVWFLSRLAHPLLKANPGAAIVNVASVAGVASTGSGGIYAMSKAAVIQLTKTLACEWASHGIRVNCVAPWVTNTPLLAAAAKPPGVHDKVAAWTPLARPAEPHEIASAVSFMLLPAAGYITGQTLCADGGLTANLFAGPCLDPPP